MDELKPCPFCGGKAVLYASENGICVICFKCEARSTVRMDSLNYSSPTCATKDVIEAWNRRADNG